ncbi:TcpE family conjugal transfer membrane protein [Actinomadura mexicana]|uniref:MinD-like ATPase involved in chromosome partitioning or flagellar assembly n=1 Tax=Actinomadura mexicana TaxID=134959 RepID=A0A238WW44_9ACTN|nr:TcpE family conjugal transfer membrane protein [Actinomadura mexicana]SNR50737.1 MinD-like ATPase involved in chromosome partitioning or flagellar assembly [Actinomadura mexicana]
MDLPTYTNIWRIEKRLYKLYDLRLPMPLPLVQIGVFLGVFVPWILLLRLVGIPFASPWHVLYIVPPGVLTWLATRPVIEGKRLTELLLSQGRYLAEPRTWCRLTAIQEPREVVIVARVWRRAGSPAPAAAAERAAIKTRRRARRRAAEPEPAAAPAATPALIPRPAVATAPPSLVEYAAQREPVPAAPLPASPLPASPLPASPLPAVPLPADPEPAVPQAAVAPPAAPEPVVPPRAWRRTSRDISHEDDVLAFPAGFEHPPATPRLEVPPPAPAPGSGKRALASGVRRPGEQAEFWQAVPAGETRPDIPQQHRPGDRRAAEETAGAPEPPPRENEQAPAPPGVRWVRPAEPGDGVTRQPPAESDRTHAADGERVRATQAFNGEPGDKKVAGAPSPHRAAPAPRIPAATRPDIPMVPGAFGAESPRPSARPQEQRAAEPVRLPTPPQQPHAPSEQPAARPEQPAARSEQPAAGSENPAAPERPAARPEHGTAPQERPSARPEVPAAHSERPVAPEQPHVPSERPAARAGRPTAPAEQGGAPTARPPVPPERRPGWTVRPPAPAPPEREAARPELPAASAEQAAAPPAPRPVPQQPPPVRPAAPPERPGVLREPPRPWSKGLSKPQRPAGSEPVAPPAQEVPPVAPPRSMEPPRPLESPRPVEEEAPPREVRSQPASPVRPRPLPPPPAPPPSGPAITPPGPEHEVTSGGLRRLIHAVGGGHGEVDADYQQRIQQPFHGTRHVVVLGCTGGAGQTVTALMLGHTFAQHNGEPVVAIDVNPGPGALARRTRSDTNETLTGLITRADQVSSLTAMRRYTSQAKSGLDVIAAGKNPLQALDDRDYALAIRTIDKFYSVTLLDAAAAVVARVLPYADQIVLVAPASADAPRAVAMTFEWLDGHGYEELRSRAVTVINGVSRRSMDDVEQAEAVARGRCRALVRIPWDDHLSMDRAPRNELKSLRTPTRRAYLALAGVVAGGFTVVPERYQELQQEQEATR